MRLLKQGASFVMVGLIQLAIDWLVFVALTKVGCGSSVANVSGRIVGASFGFWLNGAWTFSEEREWRLHGWHLLKFAVLWSMTTLVSTVIITLISHYKGLHVAWMVKPVVDIFLALLSFLVSKYWVYN
ncbi:GtrA family protein [Dyella nitratireducens]|uniref:Membrane protein n=1 Tax=Dyella nitratireducens TaxID=1849580 RepID=A0ABQ1FRR1_9GAMM|nr:GtrA family protein [Dyella nitratireducens]GGA25441.1 membrane protein [Dyella nitratireducens]GLQ43687.1 membrane protein [Dyella nitratireducens]